MNPRIVCAAIRNPTTGRIICGPRHFDPIMRSSIPSAETRAFREQGLVDQFCKFYTREEAYILARENGQIIRRCGGDDDRLFSENLY